MSWPVRPRQHAARRRQRLRVGPVPRRPRRARARRVRGAERGLLRAVQGRHARHPRVPRLRAAPARRAHAAPISRAGTPSSWRARIRPTIGAAARALVRRHLEAGDLCAVVTATNSFVTGPIAREFGVPHLVATEPEARGRALHRPRRGHALLPRGQDPARRRSGWPARASALRDFAAEPLLQRFAQRPAAARARHAGRSRWTRTRSWPPRPRAAAGR